jgi:hypothetical protein
MSFYDIDPSMPKEFALRQNQRQRLMEALMMADTIAYHQIGLIDMVVGLDDAKLLPYLKKQLAQTDQENLWYAVSMMEHIVKLTGDVELENLLSTINQDMFDQKKERQRKESFSRFVKKMKDAQLKHPVYASGSSNT